MAEGVEDWLGDVPGSTENAYPPESDPAVGTGDLLAVTVPVSMPVPTLAGGHGLAPPVGLEPLVRVDLVVRLVTVSGLPGGRATPSM